MSFGKCKCGHEHRVLDADNVLCPSCKKTIKLFTWQHNLLKNNPKGTRISFARCECGGHKVLRRGYQVFLGCTNWDACKSTMTLDEWERQVGCIDIITPEPAVVSPEKYPLLGRRIEDEL